MFFRVLSGHFLTSPYFWWLFVVVELVRRNVPGFSGPGNLSGGHFWLFTILFFVAFVWLFGRLISDFDRNFDLPDFPGSPVGPGLFLGIKVLGASGLILYITVLVLDQPATSKLPFYIAAFVIAPLIISTLIVFFLRRDSRLIAPAREVLTDYWPEFLLIIFFSHLWQSIYYIAFNIRFTGMAASLVSLAGLLALCLGAGYIALSEAMRPTVETLEG